MNSFVLNGRVAEACPDLVRWVKFMKNTEARRISETFVGPMRVSTVFIGLDHNFCEKCPPILFETMVFAPCEPEQVFSMTITSEEIPDYTRRYCTYEEAEAGHAEVVAQLRTHETCMINKDAVPQWAIQRVKDYLPIPLDIDVDSATVTAMARLLASERERCAFYCDAEAKRLSAFQDIAARPMIRMAEYLAYKIRANVDNIYGFSTRIWADEYATPERVGCIKIVLEEKYDE